MLLAESGECRRRIGGRSRLLQNPRREGGRRLEGAASPDGADIGSADGAASYKIHLVKAGGGWRGLRPPMVPTSDRRTEPPPTLGRIR